MNEFLIPFEFVIVDSSPMTSIDTVILIRGLTEVKIF